MLEVIQSDFARLEAETKAAEATAQKEYDEFMTDSEVDKAAKTWRARRRSWMPRLRIRQAEAILRGRGRELRGPGCASEEISTRRWS